MRRILAHLDKRTKYRLTNVSKNWSSYIWKRARCTEAEQARTLAMFSHVGDTLLGSALTVKLTRLVQSESRRQALAIWIRMNNVRMDADGFYVQEEAEIEFYGVARVRIRLWDWPLEEYEGAYGPNPGDTYVRRRLRQEFVRIGF